MDGSVIVAGTHLEPTGVAALGNRLRDAGMSECADRMDSSYQDGTHLFAISTDERLGFINALDDGCPDELQPLYASLKDTLITEAADTPDPSILTPGAPASGLARGGTNSL